MKLLVRGKWVSSVATCSGSGLRSNGSAWNWSNAARSTADYESSHYAMQFLQSKLLGKKTVVSVVPAFLSVSIPKRLVPRHRLRCLMTPLLALARLDELDAACAGEKLKEMLQAPGRQDAVICRGFPVLGLKTLSF